MLPLLIEVSHNLALLLSLALAIHLLRQHWPAGRHMGKVATGTLLGGVAIFCMVTAFQFTPGIYFDGRTVAVSLAGLFGGSVGALIAMTMAGVTRWLMGGQGLWIGLTGIVLSGLCGLWARHLIRRNNWPPNALHLWCVGIFTHLLVIAALPFLPTPARGVNLSVLAISYLVALPLVQVILGLLIIKQEGWFSALSRSRHAEWLFSEAQKLTHFGSWEYLLDNDRLIATPHFYELLGLVAKESPLSLQDFFGRLHRDDWDKFRLAFDAALREQSEIDVQGRLLSDDGRELWVRVMGKPVLKAGRVTQLVGNLIDITRRKTSELELRASEERLQRIIDHAQALICICTLEGRITLANNRFVVFGTPATTVIGRPIYELLPRSGALEQWIDDMVALQAGEHVEFEEVLRHSDGTVHTYLTSKFLLGSPGEQPNAICCIAADISDLRHALTSLQQLTTELTAKNDELERFGYSVAHDLKAPLVTIGSYTALLREDVAEGCMDRVTEDLGHIHDAVGRMHQLIDDLLELSRSGRTVGESSAVDLNKVVADTLILLDGDIRQTGAEIVTSGDLPVINGDAARLRQVLQNLLQNAIKYREPGHPPRIEISWVMQTDGVVQVAIRDNGRGIAPVDQTRIFDLFERAGSDVEGVGAGLTLARRIMNKHGGDILIESAGPGNGSTFALQFPPQSLRSRLVYGDGI